MDKMIYNKINKHSDIVNQYTKNYLEELFVEDPDRLELILRIKEDINNNDPGYITLDEGENYPKLAKCLQLSKDTKDCIILRKALDNAFSENPIIFISKKYIKFFLIDCETSIDCLIKDLTT